MLASLVVAVIVGGVIAAVTVMTTASTKPATTPPAHHRAASSRPEGTPATGVEPEPAATPEPRPERSVVTEPEVVGDPEPEPALALEPEATEREPEAPTTVVVTRTLPRTRPAVDVTWDPDGGRIPWWRRMRAAAGLGLATALLGASLAAMVGVGLLLAALLLDRALG